MSKQNLNDDNGMQAMMETLNAQWYNALTSGLNLSPTTFQLMQGNSVIGSLSENLWEFFDAVPPTSVNNYYNPSQLNSFSANYGSIILCLNPPDANLFQDDMGDYYSQWMSYLKTNPPIPAGGMLALFQNWSQMNMPPNQAQRCYVDYQKIYQGTVESAINLWINAGGSSTGSAKAYTTTIEQMRNAISKAPSATINMDSKTASSDVTNTWAGGEVVSLFSLFADDTTGTYNNVSQLFISSGLDITAQFTHAATISAGPLYQVSQDPILSGYKPWYNSAALNLAYKNKNSWEIGDTDPTWDSFFGQNGSMLQVCSSLIVVDGISLKISSSASFDTNQQQQIMGQATVGFWPFFIANHSSGWTNNFTFDTQGHLTYTASSPVGSPIILGAIVTPIANLW